MPLQNSGAISLDDIHVEAGGTTGTTVSINDADVRNLIGVADGATMDFADFYGATSFNTTHVLTQASTTVGSNEYNGLFTSGSVSPTTLEGYTIRHIFKLWDTTTNENTSDFWIYINGTPPADIFATVEIQCTDSSVISLNYDEAVSATVGSTYRYWQWTEADFTAGEHTQFVATFDGAGDINLSFLNNELVTNGTFATNTNGWSSASNGTLSVVSNRLQVSGTSGDALYGAVQTVTVVTGTQYRVRVETFGPADTLVQLGSARTSETTYLSRADTSDASIDLTITALTNELWIRVYGTTADSTAQFDNISVREVL